ncbi:MAG TPA: PilZ domain-containing protein [Phycisphaerae bacterium]|nr:PilZ domain-containing protein [Phycisphaerae bacterium]
MSLTGYFTPERRRHPRTHLKMMLHGVRLDPDGGDVYDTLRMLDISRSGLGALVDRWLYPGQRVILCLPLHPDGGRRNIYSTVIRCRKGRQGFQVGLQFDRVSLDAAGYAGVAAAA